MVLLAASVCTKSGKALVSRQFVEMTRSRIEGLLASFPKLIGTGNKQHTFIETESVRYVYQPMDKLYMLLITTKASNILEDLETLRLFSRVIPEYCKTIEEKEIHEHSFELIFAFDEIVALGYRENVNLAQIRTYTDMDSHEEKIFNAMRDAQQKEAEQKMREKAKELQRMKLEAKKAGLNKYDTISGSGGGGSTYTGISSSSSSSSNRGISSGTPSYELSKTSDQNALSFTSKSNRAMKLGNKDAMPAFIEQASQELKQQQQTHVSSNSGSNGKSGTASVSIEKVHMRIDEKINLTCGKDGGVHNLEVLGILYLRVASEDDGRVRVCVQNNDTRSLQLQTHPNVDKKLYTTSSLIALKDSSKSFPAAQDVGVLKWRFQSQDDNEVPLKINCWPSETTNGCDVNIEYELEKTYLELENVVITIPIPTNVSAPVIKQCDGEYSYEKYRNQLQWRISCINESNSSGSMEFSCGGKHANDYFPLQVTFVSQKSYCAIKPVDVKHVENSSQQIKFSTETSFQVDKYEII